MMRVIPLGFEPKTHSLEGCCSNPTELRNHTLFLNADAKLLLFLQSTKYFRDYLLLLLSAKCLSLNFISLTGMEADKTYCLRYSSARVSPNSCAFLRFSMLSCFSPFSRCSRPKSR